MPRSASYLVDLSGVKFDDESTETWIQAMPLGVYEHPQYGTISIDPEKVQRFVDNVKNGSRVQQLDIDYDHKEYNGEAAGWIKDADNRGTDGLWLLVDWTKKAYQLLKDKAYRYFSPEFDDEWTDPKTGTVYKDILFGGGITNRPFLKDIMPINLSEVFANVPPIKSNEGGTAMKPEDVKSFGVKLGLGESATEDQVMEALGKLDFAPKPPPVVDTPPPVSDPIAAKALEDAKKLAEGNPAVAAVMALYTAQAELVESQGKQLTSFSEKLREEEVTKTVKELCDKANKRNYSIPIPMRDSLKDTLLQLSDPKLTKVILDGFERMVESQIVALGERGYLRNNRNDEGKTATDEFNEEVKKLTDGGKIPFADAAEQVARKDPQLYSRVQSESYAFSVGGES